MLQGTVFDLSYQSFVRDPSLSDRDDPYQSRFDTFSKLVSFFENGYESRFLIRILVRLVRRVSNLQSHQSYSKMSLNIEQNKPIYRFYYPEDPNFISYSYIEGILDDHNCIQYTYKPDHPEYNYHIKFYQVQKKKHLQEREREFFSFTPSKVDWS